MSYYSSFSQLELTWHVTADIKNQLVSQERQEKCDCPSARIVAVRSQFVSNLFPGNKSLGKLFFFSVCLTDALLPFSINLSKHACGSGQEHEHLLFFYISTPWRLTDGR